MTGTHVGGATLWSLLANNAAQRTGEQALLLKRRGIWRSWDWKGWHDEASAIAAAMTARGLSAGTHVAFLGENKPRLFTAIAATHCIGGVAVPLYPDASAAELGEQLRQVEASMVFAENQEQVDKVLEVLPDCPSVKTVVFDDERGMRHYQQSDLASYDTLLEQGRNNASGAAPIGGDAPAFVFYTSRTGEVAKAAVYSHAAVIAQTQRAATAQGLGPSDRTLAYLPPGWSCQMMMSYAQAIGSGLSIWCPESSDTLLEDMREAAPTTLLVTPRVLDAIMSQVTTRMEESGGIGLSLFRRLRSEAEREGAAAKASSGPGMMTEMMLNRPLRDTLGMSQLRMAFCAGDMLDPAMLLSFRKLGINLKQLYGTTETGYLLAMQADGEVQPDTVGRAVAGIELKVTDSGELAARADGFMEGYLGDEAATAAARDADGWLLTGDVGEIGSDGSVRLIDRTDSIGRLSDGTLFAPRGVESRITTSPYVREAVTFGDGQDGVCALIDIDTLSVGRWADSQEIAYSGHADLASQNAVYGLIAEWVAEVNKNLAADPTHSNLQVRRFVLLPQELSVEDGMLSRLGKLRRAAIAEHYAPVVRALFNGAPDVALERAIDESGLHTHDDAHPARLQIKNAAVVGDIKNRSAA
ncbi:MAG: AMP-binding protein [Pseudomonadota bacterium]